MLVNEQTGNDIIRDRQTPVGQANPPGTMLFQIAGCNLTRQLGEKLCRLLAKPVFESRQIEPVGNQTQAQHDRFIAPVDRAKSLYLRRRSCKPESKIFRVGSSAVCLA